MERMDYMKRLNQILDILIGCFIGAFLGSGVSRFLDFKSHPDLYAIQSAPWYASIISQRDYNHNYCYHLNFN